MKRIAAASVLLIALCLGISACNTTQQRTAYTSIAVAETIATASVNSYFDLVIQGLVPTNDVPRISKSYNAFQQSAILAAAIAQNGTNAIAPSALIAEMSDLTNLVQSASVAAK